MKGLLEVVISPISDPDRGDYASFADLHNPDGNAWVPQERNHQPA